MINDGDSKATCPQADMMLRSPALYMLWSSLLGYAQVVLDSPATAAIRGGDILKYVDPLIGSTNGGHVFAGAVSQSTHSEAPIVLMLPVITIWYICRAFLKLDHETLMIL